MYLFIVFLISIFFKLTFVIFVSYIIYILYSIHVREYIIKYSFKLFLIRFEQSNYRLRFVSYENITGDIRYCVGISITLLFKPLVSYQK